LTITKEEDKAMVEAAMAMLKEFIAEAGDSARSELVFPRGNGFIREVGPVCLLV